MARLAEGRRNGGRSEPSSLSCRGRCRVETASWFGAAQVILMPGFRTPVPSFSNKMRRLSSHRAPSLILRHWRRLRGHATEPEGYRPPLLRALLVVKANRCRQPRAWYRSCLAGSDGQPRLLWTLAATMQSVDIDRQNRGHQSPMTGLPDLVDFGSRDPLPVACSLRKPPRAAGE